MIDNAPSPGSALRLGRPIDLQRDHYRGGAAPSAVVNLVLYGDYLCPYCRRLRHVIASLRQSLGERLRYVFRHFPNERAHPGAEFMARATEAAGAQGRFWQMHDWIYAQELPITEQQVLHYVSELGLDMERFHRDLQSEATRRRVEDDREEARRHGVTSSPTVYIHGIRYDGAWDFYSMLEAIEQPVAARVQRSARVFASLPAAGGLVLLLAAGAALVCANSPLAPYYQAVVHSSFSIGPAAHALSLTVGDWFSEGLLAIFFLLVGLEIRREITAGELSDLRSAALPIIAAVGGVVVPAAIYLIINRRGATAGWAVPTATDVAFTLGILALLGDAIPTGVRVFVAALAVVDDVLSVLTLAIFYPNSTDVGWAVAAVAAVALLYGLNRARVYVVWPYVGTAIALGVCLHNTGVHAALTGVILAGFLPTRPAPSVGPLLAQAATALAALEQAEAEAKLAGGQARRIEQEPIWDWASRNLSAATDRLLSPADRIERALAPWSAYLILPLFAFSATGVALNVDLSSLQAKLILLGVIAGLVIGKPLGISLASWLATSTRMGRISDDVTVRQFIGAACLCGVGDTVALLMAERAFPLGQSSAIAKIGVLAGSIIAASIGAAILGIRARQRPIAQAR